VLHRYWGFSNAARLSLVIGASNFALVTEKEQYHAKQGVKDAV